MTSKASKTVFVNASKGTTYLFSPLDLAIMGGADALPKDEQGPLDTPTDKAHPLFDERLKEVKLTKEWVANIFAYGVKEIVEVVRIDGVPYVVNGRTRVRGARVANLQREKEGLPLIKVEAKLARLDDLGMLKDMISLNIHFEDSTATKIAKLKRLLAMGVTLEDAANTFGIRLQTAKMWLQYDDTAVPAVKKAVNSGKIPSTTGMDIARLPAEKQEGALAEVMRHVKNPDDAPKRSGAGNKQKRAIARAAGKNPGISDRKTMKKFLASLGRVEPEPANSHEEEWWNGVEAAFEFILGNDGADNRLLRMLDKLDAVNAEEAAEEAEEEEASAPEEEVEEEAVAEPEVKGKGRAYSRGRLLSAVEAARGGKGKKGKGKS